MRWPPPVPLTQRRLGSAPFSTCARSSSTARRLAVVIAPRSRLPTVPLWSCCRLSPGDSGQALGGSLRAMAACPGFHRRPRACVGGWPNGAGCRSGRRPVRVRAGWCPQGDRARGTFRRMAGVDRRVHRVGVDGVCRHRQPQTGRLVARAGPGRGRGGPARAQGRSGIPDGVVDARRRRLCSCRTSGGLDRPAWSRRPKSLCGRRLRRNEGKTLGRAGVGSSASSGRAVGVENRRDREARRGSRAARTARTQRQRMLPAAAISLAERFSMSSSQRLASLPPMKLPMPDLLVVTRWQGMTMGIGFSTRVARTSR